MGEHQEQVTAQDIVTAFDGLDVTALSDQALADLETAVQRKYEQIGHESMRRFYLRQPDHD